MRGVPEHGGAFRGIRLRYELVAEAPPGESQETVLLTHEFENFYPGQPIFMPRVALGKRPYMEVRRWRLTVLKGDGSLLGDAIHTIRMRQTGARMTTEAN